MVRIDDLAWDEQSENHIARHGVTREEVEDAVRTRPFISRARDGLYRVVGQTLGGRYLTVLVAPRADGPFYVVTARDAEPRERRGYRRR